METRSNMQLADLNSKPHGRKILRDFIDRTIGSLLYTTPGSEHYKILRLYQLHGPYHINDNYTDNNDTKYARIE